MKSVVCPWWAGRALDNPLRPLLHPLPRILAPYLSPGMTAIDLGCGRGFASLAMARLVGPTGCVHAFDIQQQMLDALRQRALRQGLSDRIVLHQSTSNDLGLRMKVNFALAFWMMHEVPNATTFIQQVRRWLLPGGRLLLVEPRWHVSAKAFAREVGLVREQGLVAQDEPPIGLSRATLFQVQ